MALATVIIPCGPRHIHLLPRAIESARAQTVPTEVLWFIDTEKRGPGYGRDLLAAQVKTPFTVMLDADDYLHPAFVEKTFAAWLQNPPHTYIYTDWETPNQGHKRAVSCYGLTRKEGESLFHLPPTLFPTRLYHAIGGHDHSLWMAEDTDFFLKANASGIRSDVVREPLFFYTDEGYRSKEGFKDPRWNELAQSVYKRYQGRLSMACCGKPGVRQVEIRGRQEGDILVRPLWNARMHTTGRVTGRKYGSIGRALRVWLDPRDFNEREYERILDPAPLAPTADEIKAALAIDGGDRVAQLEAAIRKAGVRIWGDTPVKVGFDMQQTPREAAVFLAKCEELGVKTVLEIGTGESAGFARFMTEVLGWSVTSVDPETPKVTPAGNWQHIKMTSDEYEPTDLFDMVFIDGDHGLEQSHKDWDKYKDAGRIIGFHDIALDGWWADGCALVWKEISRTPKGNLRKGFGEHIEKLGKQGLGWFIHDAD